MIYMYLKLADWASIAEIVLAAIAVLALIGAVAQVAVARSVSRETLTYNYTERQLAALLVPNLFEELAGMYNQGLLHKGITKDWELMLRDMDLPPAISVSPPTLI